MADYLYKIKIPSGVSFSVPIPVKGGVGGVYSPGGSIDIVWVYNGINAPIMAATDVWEPLGGFNPRPDSLLKITNAGDNPAEVSIRLYDGE